MNQLQTSFTLEFGYSPSPNYKAAVELAEKEEQYEVIGRGREILHRVHYTLDEMHRCKPLYELIGGWKSFRVTYQDETVSWYLLQNQLADCWRIRNEVSGPESYCLSTESTYRDFPDVSFGCRRLYSAHARWYSFGKFDENGVWLLDKESIRKMLAEEIKKTKVELCPAFNRENSLCLVSTLPDRIDPKQEDPTASGKFEYVYAYPGGIKTAVGVEWKKHDVVSRYESEFLMKIQEIRQAYGTEQQPQEQPTRETCTASYADIGGLEETIKRIRQIVEWPLKYPDMIKRFGVKPHRGVLLYGPPGCGKTLLAKAVAGETESSLYLVNGPEILSKYIGESEENLRRIFQEAKANEPSIILFDELDGLAINRDQTSFSYESTLVTQLLSLMDGMIDAGRVMVIATTNRLDAIDLALRRPGRFDVSIEIPLPDLSKREHIFQIHTSKMPLDSNLEVWQLAVLTDGYSGADIEALCREAAYRAMERCIDHPNEVSSEQVTVNDFEYALKIVKPT